MSTFFVTYLPHNLAPGTIILNAVKRPLPLSKGPLHEHTFLIYRLSLDWFDRFLMREQVCAGAASRASHAFNCCKDKK